MAWGAIPGGGPPPAPNLPLQYAYWVAQLDTPPATPDGTDEAPFERVSQCLLAVGGTVPVGATITIFLVGSSTGFANTQGGQDRSITIIGMDERASVGNVGMQCADASLGHDPVVFTVHNASVGTITVQSSQAGTDPTPFEYFHTSDSPINDCGQIDATGYVAADGTTPVTFPLVLNGSLLTQGASGKNAVLSMEGGGIVNTALDIDSVDSIAGTEIIATDIAVQNVGAFRGLVSCSFFSMGGKTWTGPAASFRADELSGSTFFNAGGTLAGGATIFTTNGSGCNQDFGTNQLSPGSRAFGQNNTCNFPGLSNFTVGGSNSNLGDASCVIGNGNTIVAGEGLIVGDNNFSTEGRSILHGASGTNFLPGSFTQCNGSFDDLGQAQTRVFTYRGETPGLAPGETTVLLTGGLFGPGLVPYALEPGKTYGAEIRAVGTVMGLGAAPRQSTDIYYRVTIDVDSAGTVVVSAGSGFTQTFNGAGLVNAFLDTIVPGPNQLDFVWTMGPGDTVHSRCVLTLSVVEVFGD
jgi:hypothetical protein